MKNIPLHPLLFEPFLRPMPWGGRRLANWLDTPLPEKVDIGEAWLLSDHALHSSVVKEGPLAAFSLHQLMEHRAEELLGHKASRFPLLVKLLDARDNLSVQVHPDDEAAKRWAPKEGGKTEAWIVLEADPHGTIFLDLKPGVDRATFAEELQAGTVSRVLQRIHPKPGECYFIPAGTVHALGGGLVVLEVQQTSDATFRLYDWGRLDAAGNPRQLHLEAGLACFREHNPGAGLQQPRDMPGQMGCERLVDCDYFHLNRCLLVEPLSLTGPCLWVGLRGRARVAYEKLQFTVLAGQLILVPSTITCRIEPEGSCLGAWITLPR